MQSSKTPGQFSSWIGRGAYDLLQQLSAREKVVDSSTPRTTPQSFDFILSYSKEDEAFARRIVAALEEAGYSALAQYKDLSVGSNFVQKELEANRVIALLSPAYEASPHCQAEWNAVYAADPNGTKRKLVPLLIEPKS
jgi:isopentenyl diphosphate isomerase/L-lactate dehydrogenase-like FMN-dependent dehydrogenase